MEVNAHLVSLQQDGPARSWRKNLSGCGISLRDGQGRSTTLDALGLEKSFSRPKGRRAAQGIVQTLLLNLVLYGVIVVGAWFLCNFQFVLRTFAALLALGGVGGAGLLAEHVKRVRRDGVEENHLKLIGPRDLNEQTVGAADAALHERVSIWLGLQAQLVEYLLQLAGFFNVLNHLDRVFVGLRALSRIEQARLHANEMVNPPKRNVSVIVVISCNQVCFGLGGHAVVVWAGLGSLSVFFGQN